MKLLYVNSVCVFGSVIFLSACGGSDGGSSGRAALAQLDKGYKIVEKYDGTEETKAMPTRGTADYKGVAAYSTTRDISDDASDVILATRNKSPEEILEIVQATSDVTLTADFATSKISGSLTNFNGEDGAIKGSVGIKGDIVGSSISGSLNGTLDGETVTGQHEGAFYGDGAAAVAAGMTGTVGGTFFSGIWVAEQ